MPNYEEHNSRAREMLIELSEQALAYDGTGREMRFTGGDVPVLRDATPKWIPVTERLPEAGDRVIACGAKGGVFMIRATSIAGFGKVDGASSHRYYTHWMPLPEPPTE